VKILPCSQALVSVIDNSCGASLVEPACRRH